ncbi:dihydrodipicolinate synthase family protein [Rhizosaccharibacter radicis]|uniref:Dihydrodipicolinate synthase family protein n=1 Tax=Rhizosaccharibacter radicis TaxID=2782605 RepID=A0ABT1VUN9_9PROT|nr:dihydrodipicolinate synthase family protein [Acetobacteraceae bacterium KSS12]
MTIRTARPAATNRKTWTRDRYRGIENLLLPSFGPDLRTLDEDAIRRDVRAAIAHGCFSTLYASLGHDVSTTIRALEVACDEAGGRILVGAFTEYPTLAPNVALVRGAAAAGCSHVLTMYPPQMTPRSEQEVHDYLQALIDAADIGIVLYATPHPGIEAFDPTGVALDVFDRLADLPTVAALKLTQTIDPTLARICCARFGDRLAINCVPLELMPLLAREFDIVWSGQWAVEGVQGPDRRLVAEYVALIAGKKFEAAEALYWTLHPAYKLFSAFQVPKLKLGGHPWQHLKYYQWLTGGNGGLVSVEGQSLDQVGKLLPGDREKIHATFAKLGIAVTRAAEHQFITGVEAADRGVGAEAFVRRPFYE